MHFRYTHTQCNSPSSLSQPGPPEEPTCSHGEWGMLPHLCDPNEIKVLPVLCGRSLPYEDSDQELNLHLCPGCRRYKNLLEAETQTATHISCSVIDANSEKSLDHHAEKTHITSCIHEVEDMSRRHRSLEKHKLQIQLKVVKVDNLEDLSQSRWDYDPATSVGNLLNISFRFTLLSFKFFCEFLNVAPNNH